MRAVILGLASLTIASQAMAADYLRGSYDPPQAKSYNWSGTYIGAQFGYSSTSYTFSKATESLVANILRQTLVETEGQASELPNLPNRDIIGTGFGFFVGYNSQWGDAVVGLELNYSRIGGDTAVSTEPPIGRVISTSNDFDNDITINSSATARLTDLMSLRMRGGYAWGWLMPYGMVGLALGRADASRTADVVMTETDVSSTALDPTDGIPPRVAPGTPVALQSPVTQSKKGAFTFGYMLGAGVDIGLFPGVFVRGEWEYAQLSSVLGVPISLHSFRVGAAVKF
jgi:opacity protein-like surface antigen